MNKQDWNEYKSYLNGLKIKEKSKKFNNNREELIIAYNISQIDSDLKACA